MVTFSFVPGDHHRSANHFVAHRTLNIATVFSAVLLAFSVLLFPLGYMVDPSEYHFSIREDAHVGISSGGFDSRLVFFNDAEYGPYRGSIIGLDNANGNIYSPLARTKSFGDSWGIYYRRFQWSEYTLWTLTVTLWYPVAVFAIMAFFKLCRSAVWRRSRDIAEQ